MKRHNEQYRKEALILRRRAVVWLRDQGHDIRSIGYAVGVTPEKARAIIAKDIRLRVICARVTEFCAKTFVKNYLTSKTSA